MTVVAEIGQKPRILTLSDLIFGLALSIGAISLIGQKPGTVDQLFTSLGLYGLSFFILISVWGTYSRITSILPSETPVLSSLNIVLLFLVSIEPYLFAELFTGTGALPFAVGEVYAFDIGFMFLIVAIFNHALTDEQRHLAPKITLGRYRWMRNTSLVMAVVFFISSLPSFDSVTVFVFTIGGVPSNFTLRSTLWFVGLLTGWSSRLLERALKR